MQKKASRHGSGCTCPAGIGTAAVSPDGGVRRDVARTKGVGAGRRLQRAEGKAGRRALAGWAERDGKLAGSASGGCCRFKAPL